MAQVFLKAYAGERFEVHSAGLEPQRMHPYTVRVMEEAGYDLGVQDSTHVSQYLGRTHFGYVITVCGYAETHCPKTFLGVSQRLHWPIVDPTACRDSEEQCLQLFRQVRDKVDTYVKSWLEDLEAPVQEGS